MAPRMNNLENFSLSNNINADNVHENENNNDNEIDTDDEDNLSDIYVDDEQSPTKYNLILCELYNTRLHGSINITNIYNYYLVMWKYKTINIELINEDCELAHNEYLYLDMSNQTHSIYRNYENIVKSEKYIQPEIAECIVLESGHTVAIKKTIWLRLIQRCWKNIFRKRKDIFQKRCSLASILYREIHGYWPSDCRIMPTLQGMLQPLTFNV
jgi:hypothetical protein